jgi:hypothetical protein
MAQTCLPEKGSLAKETLHIWATRLPAGLPASVHTIAARAIDEFGQQHGGT